MEIPVAALCAALLATTRIYVLDDAAAHADQPAAEDKDVLIERPSEALSGLHAKVYVIEDGAKVRVVTGSANATSAAWGWGQEPANVEFVVELNGPRRAVGMEILLGEEGSTASESGGLLRILKPYHPPSAPLDPDLDRSAVATIRQWRFAPATLKGSPVPVVVEVEMSFTIAR
jgi:hypothetical protein